MIATEPGRAVPHDPRWDAGFRVEPCVCGGTLVAYLGDDIREVVEAHNGSLIHLQWRAKSLVNRFANDPEVVTIGA